MDWGEGCTDPFLLQAKQSIRLRKVFQFQVCTLYCVWGRTHRSGRFRWLNKKGGVLHGPSLGEVRWKPFPAPPVPWLPRSLSLPGVFFCWIERTHRLIEPNCRDLLHKSSLFLKRIAIFCHHSRTGTLHPGMHTARTLRLESRRKDKRIMRKLHSQSPTSNEQYSCCPDID